MRRKIILPAVKITAILTAVVGVGYVSTLDRDPSGYRIPACQSEDSPSCVWTDPDTGRSYVHGYDAGMSIQDKTGFEWCLPGRVNTPCLDVIGENE